MPLAPVGITAVIVEADREGTTRAGQEPRLWQGLSAHREQYLVRFHFPCTLCPEAADQPQISGKYIRTVQDTKSTYRRRRLGDRPLAFASHG
jgi:hypothetical protein